MNTTIALNALNALTNFDPLADLRTTLANFHARQAVAAVTIDERLTGLLAPMRTLSERVHDAVTSFTRSLDAVGTTAFARVEELHRIGSAVGEAVSDRIKAVTDRAEAVFASPPAPDAGGVIDRVIAAGRPVLIVFVPARPE